MSSALTPGTVWIHGPSLEEHEVLMIHDEDGKIEVSTIHPPEIYRNDEGVTAVKVSSWHGTRSDFLAEFMPPAAA